PGSAAFRETLSVLGNIEGCPARARPRRPIVMRFARSRAQSPSGFGRASNVLLILLLSTTMAAIGPPARASGAGDDPTGAQQQASAAPPVAPDNSSGLCEVLATAAASNDLPVDFFTRLIWRESRFKPDATSPAGAQGIAQFMPATARLRGLEDPFNPLEAIAKSGELLHGLRREFGNLGLAAAAYNAGSGRVRDWRGRRRPLPRATR